MSVMLLSAATMFAISGDAPQTPVLVAVGLAGSFAARDPLSRTLRSFIYAGLAAMTATILSELTLPVDPDRFFLVPAELYCPGILLAGVAATYFDQRDSNVTSVMALAILGMMLAGNVVGFTDEYERMPLAPLHLSAIHVVYAILVAIQVGAMLGLLPRVRKRCPLTSIQPDERQSDRSGKSRESGRASRYSRLRYVLIGGGFMVAAVLVMGLRTAALHYDRKYQNLFAGIFRRYMFRRAKRVVFGRQVDLWRTVPLRTRADDRVVLRALATEAPGYLRGYTYGVYADGHWSESGRPQALPFDPPVGQLTFSTFRRELPAKPVYRLSPSLRVDVLPDRDFRSDVLLAPGTAETFELVATNLANSPGGTLHPAEWEEDAGYGYTYPSRAPDTAYPHPPRLPAALKARYLDLEPSLRKELEPISRDLFSDSGDASEHGFLKLGRLLRFLQSGFRYELGVEIDPERGDPVIQFLRDIRRGHCELFASAAVLLLRSQGIPARYVTGFVCSEYNPNGGYWITRLGDAHAWAEAYIEEQGRWVTFEGTPPDGIPRRRSTLGGLDGFQDRVRTTWKRIFSQMKRGVVLQAVVSGSRRLLRTLIRILLHPLLGPLILISAPLALYLIVRILAFRAAEIDPLLDPVRAELRAVFTGIERFLGRKGVLRPPGATIREYSALLEHNGGATIPDGIRELLLEYEQYRFGGDPPSRDVVRGFSRRVRAVLKDRPPPRPDAEP